VGDTNSSDFPVSPNAYQKTLRIQDAFIARIDLGASGPAIMLLLMD
jgi:hypothetical protein